VLDVVESDTVLVLVEVRPDSSVATQSMVSVAAANVSRKGWGTSSFVGGQPLRHNSLETEFAGVPEHGGAVLVCVLVEHDRGPKRGRAASVSRRHRRHNLLDQL
jgi:hypothetical protein